MGLIVVDKEGRPTYSDGSKCNLREKLICRILWSFCSTHPCMGARTVAGKGNLFVSLQSDVRTVASAFSMLNDLTDYFELSDWIDPTEKTCAVAFYGEPISSQVEFAELYWDFLQVVHDVDCLFSDWDADVSSDITSVNFEASFKGRAIFTTTLNPQNPRIARKFAYPVWIMNQTSQFNHLRSIGRFTEWQRKIRRLDADMDPSGEPNPILADHGHGLAANQLAS